MEGKTGFTHKCTETLIEKSAYKRSLKNSPFSNAESNLLWDFYVARSFAAKTGTPISLESYGWKENTNKTNGLPVLENALAQNAGIESFAIIRGKTIMNTLSAMGLSDDKICVTHARAVLIQKFSCDYDENDTVKVKSSESRICAIFRHIRNSFAHGNTYFFDNGMCLLEDKDGNSISAAILLPMQSLIEWIYIVDRNGIHYEK